MRVLIRQWTVQGAERSFVDYIAEAQVLSLGRGTDQNVQLADPKAELAHAQIVPVGNNIHVVAKPGATLRVNGEPSNDHKLRSGDVIEIGSYRLQIGAAPAGADFQLDVEEAAGARVEAEQPISRLRTSLADLGISRRVLSWALFLAVLATTMALPLWLRFGLNVPSPAGPAAVISDRAWSPGPLSAPHAGFDRDCGKCHQKAFEAVSNDTCLGCHKDTRHHIDDVKLASSPAMAAQGCSDCHREHHGSATLIDSQSAQCQACHAQLPQRFPGTRLQAVDGFAAPHSHPQIAPLVARYDVSAGRFDWIETDPHDPGPQHSDTNLRFSHAQHLAAAGMRSPEGSKSLKCGDCHEPDENAVSFKPVRMERHCASCHRLDFDPEDPQRTVPHAQPVQVAGVLRDYYAHAALAGGFDRGGAPAAVRQLRLPGQTLSPQQARPALAWADHQASVVIEEVFKRRLCSTCHVVTRTGDAAVPFAITPVAPQLANLMPHAQFSHAAHRGEPCTSCHAATGSEHSEDVLMPDLKRCRDCHGEPGSSAKAPSTCLTCHGFHVAARSMAAAAPASRATDTPR